MEPAYLEETVITVIRKYNPKYGDDRLCRCGHTYYRHFDTYDYMEDVGCKYCECNNFELASSIDIDDINRKLSCNSTKTGEV